MTKEMLEMARQAAGAEELMTLAKANGVELDEQQAAKLFASLHAQATSELGENDLFGVSGGSWQRPPVRKKSNVDL